MCMFPYPTKIYLLYSLKTPENLWFSGVFRGLQMRALARNGVNGSSNSSTEFKSLTLKNDYQ